MDAQLRHALLDLSPNAFVMPVFALFICLMFSQWISIFWLAIWWMFVTVAGIPLGIACHRANRAGGRTRLGKSERRFAIASHLLFVVAWASMAWFLWVPDNIADYAFLTMILAGTLAGNVALVGANKALTASGYVVYGAVFVLLPLRQHGTTSATMTILALLFVGYLMLTSTRIYSTALRMLTLNREKTALLDEKNALIEALSHSKTESDRANKTKSEFLANMSHELRTPLNAIIGFAELLQSRLVSGKDEEYFGLINRAGHHLLSLINDILDLSKIDAGKFVLTEAEFDVRILIGDCIQSMQPRANQGGLLLHSDWAEDLPNVFADERCLRQILLNLLSNAIKFTRPGGEVRASALIDATGEMRLEVRDNGVGIAQDDQERVFESFGQGRHDIVAEERGTGLGLPIVRGLVEAHGGRVALESTAGKGTRVTVFLPADRVRQRAKLWPDRRLLDQLPRTYALRGPHIAD